MAARYLRGAVKGAFEEVQVEEVCNKDIRLISGCEDKQVAADVSNVASFKLPDTAGRAGGATTSALLNVLYHDHHKLEEDLTFVQVLTRMREILKLKKFAQIPQLSSTCSMNVNKTFDFVPSEATGTRRAVLIGINYVGHKQGVLSGCHNDVKNMLEYIREVHGFQDANITILLDDGVHQSPTYDNIMNAYKKIIADSQPGDAVFCHYSGHGTKIPDDNGDEPDGYDEALVPLDYEQKGLIRDDLLFDILIKPMKPDVHAFFLMDCCHSGTILDLPYEFKCDGTMEQMQLKPKFNVQKFIKNVGKDIKNFLKRK